MSKNFLQMLILVGLSSATTNVIAAQCPKTVHLHLNTPFTDASILKEDCNGNKKKVVGPGPDFYVDAKVGSKVYIKAHAPGYGFWPDDFTVPPNGMSMSCEKSNWGAHCVKKEGYDGPK